MILILKKNIVSKITEIFLVLLLKAILDYSYYYISVNVNISNLYNIDFNLINYLNSWLITILIYSAFLYKHKIKISILFLLIYILYILPNIVYFGLANKSLYSLSIIICPYIIILFSTFNFNYNLKKEFKIDINYFFWGSLVLTLLVLFHLINSSNGNFVKSIDEVYKFRIMYESINMQGYWAYLNSWVFKVFSLLLLIIAFYKRNRLYIFISLFLIISLFLFSGYKSVFLSLFIIVFFFFLFKINWNRVITLFSFILFFSIILLITILLSLDNMTVSILIRRLLFVPTVLNFAYIDFFSSNEYIYWSNSFLKSFNSYPYDKNFALILGEYLNLSNTYANSGFVAMGYAHAGLLGVLIYTIIGIVIVNYINSLITLDNKFIQLSLVFIPLYIFFVSSDLLTTLLTHGLFIVLILMLFLFFIKNKR